jgi:hypothetical protein
MTVTHPTSQNGWPVLGAASTFRWEVPGTDEHLILAPGAAGFVLLHLATWFDHNIERIDKGQLDDWGWAVRNVRGSTTQISNHSSGTAIDINATRHVRGVAASRSFTPHQIQQIHHKLEHGYGGHIGWGGDYRHSPIDSMHFEIVAPLHEIVGLANHLRDTANGRRVLAANPKADW